MKREVELVASGPESTYTTARYYRVRGAKDERDALAMAKKASGCNLCCDQWREEYKANPSMENYFRESFAIYKLEDGGEYLFRVTIPCIG